MRKNPLISIITATYNCEEYIDYCLKSVANQKYTNIEHIVVDGLSTDKTLEIINLHINNISIFKSEKDSGIYDALNKGIRLANGDVIGFLHADDFYVSDDVLAKVSEAFEEDQSLCGVYSDLEYVSKNNINKQVRKWISKPFRKSLLLYGWMPGHPTLFIKKEWYLKIGCFDTSYHISADYLSILQLFSNPNFKSKYLPITIVKMRVGGVSNKSIKSIVRKSLEDWRALRSSNFSIPNSIFALLIKNLSKITQFY